MTIGELNDFIKGYQEKMEDIAIFNDSLNHILGTYIGVAVNSPKKYPKKPALKKRQANTLKRAFSEAETEKWLAENNKL